MANPNILFHVQHLLGIGHLRRAAAIVRALCDVGADVTLVSGGEPIPHLKLGKARLEQLPPAVAADAAFSSILDADGRPIDDAWRDRRKARLVDLFTSLRPDIVVLEMYPFGRRAFRFELLPLLAAARAARPAPLIVCSVRDILVDKGRTARRQEAVDIVRRYFDLVLVHGDPALVDFTSRVPEARAIADKLRYTGYVVEPTRIESAPVDRRRGEILVSVGGGAVGLELLLTSIKAKPLSVLKDSRWRIVTGQNLPEPDFRRVGEEAAGEGGIALDRFRADFRDRLGACRLSISQAGYNTVMELMACRTPAIVVPFADGQESEQSVRARLLAAKGLLSLVEAADLSPNSLARAIDSLVAREGSGIPSPDLALDGAQRSANLLIAAWEALGKKASGGKRE